MATWQDRIVGEGYEHPDNILANPYNYRIHSKFQQDSLEGVLDTVGWVQRVIINVTTQHLIDGHLRVTLADRHGVKKVPVVYVELTEDEEKLVLATLDPLSALAIHDKAQYDGLMRGVVSDNAAIQALLADTAEKMGVLYNDIEFPEYDESVADDVEFCECPNCGHKFPK
jgi:hypothetical protein